MILNCVSTAQQMRLLVFCAKISDLSYSHKKIRDVARKVGPSYALGEDSMFCENEPSMRNANILVIPIITAESWGYQLL
jgi:hypothetical protein